MHDRIQKLKDLLQDLKSDSFSDQYGLSDLVESDPQAKAKMDKLAAESALYQGMLQQLSLLNM